MKTPLAAPSLYLVNGQQQDTLSVADRGLAYGDGLFETMRFKGQHLPVWPLHWQRLTRGAEVLQLPLDQPAIEDAVKTALAWAQQQRIADGTIKLVVTRGQGGQGYLPPGQTCATVIVIVKPLVAASGDSDSTDTIELVNCTYKLNYNSTLAGLKHLNRLEQVLAAQSVTLQEQQQGLVFDKNDRIIETLHHNLFLVKNKTLFTPDLSRCGVAGTVRAAILELFAPALGIPTAVGDLYSADLISADEVFICNSVRGITSVSRWQKSTWTDNAFTQKLMQHISRQWNKLYDR